MSLGEQELKGRLPTPRPAPVSSGAESPARARRLGSSDRHLHQGDCSPALFQVSPSPMKQVLLSVPIIQMGELRHRLSARPAGWNRVEQGFGPRNTCPSLPALCCTAYWPGPLPGHRLSVLWTEWQPPNYRFNINSRNLGM